MKLTFDKNLFTTSFRKYRAAIASGKRFVVLFGAADSSKSYSAHQDIVLDLLTAKDDILIIRKNSAHLEDSCYKLIKSIIVDWGLSDDFLFYNSQQKRQVVYKKSGKSIVFKGINDPEALKSIVGFYRLLIEEANQLDFTDFKELNRRLRSNQKIQILLLLNPVSEDHWIKTQLIDSPAFANSVETCRVTYHDNEFITQERIEELERYKLYSEYDYQVYVMGEWGIIRPDNPYFHKFDPNKNLTTGLIYDPTQPVYVTHDFNITNSVLIRQKINGQLRYLKEYHIKGMDLEDICQDIVISYGRRNLIFLSGDASGNARSAYTTGNLSAWSLIVGYLKKYGAVAVNIDSIPISNPSLASSRFICNALIQHYNTTKGLLIDRAGCPVLISDVQKMKTSTDGGLDKHEANKEDYGHMGDCLRYDLCNFEYTTFKNLGLHNRH